jgi:hypothetical protein
VRPETHHPEAEARDLQTCVPETHDVHRDHATAAAPPRVALAAEGYKIFYLTSRGQAQEMATLGLSDLDGGLTDKTFKIPNPNHFLP